MNNPTQTLTVHYAKAPFFQIRQTLHSDRAYESHAHSSLSIGYMLEGKTRFRLPQGAFLLQKGALALIEPHTQHACNSLEHTRRSYVMVYFDAAFCLKIQSELFGPTQTLLPLRTPLVFHQRLCETFERLINSLLKSYTTLHVRALEVWLKEFLWLYSEPDFPNETPSSMREIARFLESRIDEPLSLSNLAQRFGYNPFVLLRHFKASYGCTPKHYGLDQRIEHAKELLQKGVSIAMCAQYCGFSDQSHFHRFFKRRTALTPKEYQVNFVQ